MEYNLIVINSSNEIGYSRYTCFSLLEFQSRQQIIAEEDQKIFEMLDALESSNNDI